MADDEQRRPPDYKVYRSRRGPLGGLRDSVSGLGERFRGSKGEKGGEEPKRGSREPGRAKPERSRPPVRRILKWAGLAALGWLLLSILAFGVSATIQKGKLADGVTDELGGGPLMLASPQTILVLGTDIRPPGFGSDAEVESEACREAVSSGEANDESCTTGPFRSDTMMLVRAGGGVFRKLSIPRDTVAEIPGVGVDKINAAYANGGAALAAETVEGFTGTPVDQVAILDFDGFRRFIDSLGGIEVDLDTPVCSTVSGGAFNLNLDKGTTELDGFKAITLARTRSNSCGEGQFTGTDLEREGFQAAILDGIKGRLTDPLRLPYNFIKGPFIGWNAPKAMVSSMGGLTMPQVAIAAATGSGDSIVMVPDSLDPLTFSQEECERAVEEFLGKEPPETPGCSPG
ncbi:hypothetical protein HJD18_13000 [Thermoleophilia bacterium SCSIO 60948]|nr:hypothetical protein HJD18_13000 [Thermoleophilia bacterium SCSIO 60948]